MKRTCLIVIRSLFVLVLTLNSVATAGIYDGWSRRMKITFSGYNPPGGGTLTNFPALVVFSNGMASGFSYRDFRSGTNADLRFANSNETTALNYEIESWDTNGNAYVWVQMPTLASASDYLWVYWGRSGSNAPPCTTNGATWDGHYKGIWHFSTNGAALTTNDSTINGNTGTIFGSVTAGSGQVDGDAKLDGSSGYIYAAPNASTDIRGPFTVDVWAYFNALPGSGHYPNLIGRLADNGANGCGYGMWCNGDSGGVVAAIGNNSGNWYVSPIRIIAANNWYHFAGVYDGGHLRLYVNGSEYASPGTANTFNPALANNGVIMGRHYSSATYGYINGALDEARISDVARSPGWLWAEWMNMASNGTFNTCGSVQDRSISVAAVTGGDVTKNIPGYRIHIFTNAGTSTFNVTLGGNVEVLVVGGGGGGGKPVGGGNGGGGGAGGFVTDIIALTNGSYSVTVGAGGLSSISANGGDSILSTITAKGGGAGGYYGSPLPAAAVAGGSGGGGAQTAGLGAAGTAGQGNAGGSSTKPGGNGGWGGGGGGGAGAVGNDSYGANGREGGAGGVGLSSSISGTTTWYAGGGGGATHNTGTAGGAAGGQGGGGAGEYSGAAGQNGVANTGGGGGSGGESGLVGGNGGSGIVILMYAVSDDVPGVDNAAGATNVTLTSAWLNGTLVSTGASATAVLVYWGTADGGTNADAWANTNAMLTAPQTPGALKIQANSLASNLTYYYRFAATNAAGMNWAGSCSEFMTSPVWVEASDAVEGSQSGTFTVHRASSATNAAITVNYAISGTAVSGVDYVNNLGTSVTFALGASNAMVVVTPLVDNDNLNDTTVTLTLANGPYLIGSPASATMTISNRFLPYYVDVANGSDGNTASQAANPATPWRSIRHALSMVSSGDVVYVAAGTYGTATETFPLTMINGVTIQGAGFLTTIIDAGSLGGSGTRVFTCSNISAGKIDGFTIQGGADQYGVAGGLYALNSHLAISNNRFTRNTCSGYGPSTILCDGGAPQIINNLVVGNFAQRSVICCQNGGNALIANNTMVGNISDQWDAGMWNCGAINVQDGSTTPVIKNCILWNNTVNLSGNCQQSMVNNCCVGGTFGALTSGIGYSGVQGNISSDPLFVDGYFLSQTAAGQSQNSPCVGTGIGTPASWGGGALTTRSDGQADGNASVDMGFHFPTTGYVAGAQVYVSANSGSDTRTLTQAQSPSTPWRSITRALNVATTNGLGWTIYVAAGSYNLSVETLPLNLVDTVTLQGAGYATTTIDAQNVSHTQGINAYGVVRGKLDGFTIQGCNNDYDRPVYFQWCSMDITRNRIMNNQAWQGYYAGGGVHISGGAPFVANDLIISNTSDACSGIFIDGWGYPVIENCTIATNTTRMSTSVWDGGALIASYSVPIIRNCIIWGNTTGNIVLDQSKVSNCDFQDGYMSGTAGCISADPQFVGNNDYHLGKASPCVNAGTNQAWMAGNTDLDGSRRVSNGKVDMGVYEVNTAGTVLFFH